VKRPSSVASGLGLAGALVLTMLASTGCFIRALGGQERQLTGTCDGACAYYLGCKHADEPAARAQCTAECEEIFASPERIREFESLACEDAVEFVDGNAAVAARDGR
jgi:hypothetical protein